MSPHSHFLDETFPHHLLSVHPQPSHGIPVSVLRATTRSLPRKPFGVTANRQMPTRAMSSRGRLQPGMNLNLKSPHARSSPSEHRG
jgi:hypothetical protein